MTQKNINTMDTIVSLMVEGKTLSKALKLVYEKRNVSIPYCEDILDVTIKDLKMLMRTTRGLVRGGTNTIKDLIDTYDDKYDKIMKLEGFGKSSAIETLEAVLDYCWKHLSEEDRVKFLIDAVERNSDNLKIELV